MAPLPVIFLAAVIAGELMETVAKVAASAAAWSLVLIAEAIE